MTKEEKKEKYKLYRKKYKQQRNKYKLEYYKKTALYKPSKWTEEKDKQVLEHKIIDRELSKLINKSVQAIQIRRCRLLKLITEDK